MKKAAQGSLQVATANALASGAVVFRTQSGRWSPSIDEAHVAADAEAVAALLSAAERDVEQNLVVDAYLVDVRRDETRIVPTKLREAIRALGPTVPLPASPELEAAA